jgi:hypothetical protein
VTLNRRVKLSGERMTMPPLIQVIMLKTLRLL